LSNAAVRPHNPYFRKIKLLLFSESPVGNTQSNNASRPAEITRSPLALYFYATIFRYIRIRFADKLHSIIINVS